MSNTTDFKWGSCSEDTSVEHGYRAQHNAIKDFNPINVLERHAYQWTVVLAS
jgi:hypothetical protein